MKAIILLTHCLAFFGAFAAPFAASALAPRTFVSGAGVDVGACAVAVPCRTFAYAITQTSAGGEIVAVDTAGYGAVTIDKSLTIASATHAAISVFSGNGITIAASASDVVVLRGLVITGIGGSDGVRVIKAGFVRVERCLVSGFSYPPGNGIEIASDAAVDVTIADSIIRGNFAGVVAVSTSGPPVDSRVTVLRARVQDNANGGLSFSDIRRVAIIDSFVGNNGFGIQATATQHSYPFHPSLVIDRTTIADNLQQGIHVRLSDYLAPITFMYVSGSTISGNEYGVIAEDTTVVSVMSSVISGNVYPASYGSISAAVNTLRNNMCYGNFYPCVFTQSIPLN